jgi:hypothetical protein
MLISLVVLNACSSDGEDEDVLAEEGDGEAGASPVEGDGGEEEEESAESAESAEAGEEPPSEEPASDAGPTDFNAMLKAMGGQAPAAAPVEAAPEGAAAPEVAAAPEAAAPKSSKASKAGKASAGKTRKLKSAVLAVREGPSLKAKVVGYIHGDVSVTIVAEGWNGWTKIGPKRFVRSKYLTKGGTKTVGAGQRSFVVKSEALYIRNAPSLDATVAGVLTSGDKVRAEPVASGWVQLGPRRFVRAKYLEVVGH